MSHKWSVGDTCRLSHRTFSAFSSLSEEILLASTFRIVYLDEERGSAEVHIIRERGYAQIVTLSSLIPLTDPRNVSDETYKDAFI